MNNKESLSPSDYDLFIGMDVGKSSNVITLVDHDGLIKTKKIPYDPDHLVKYIMKNYRRKKVVCVYEAGPTGYGLYDKLVGAGHACMVVSPSKVPMVAKQQVKTNRLDSVKLALALKGGQIQGIRVPSPAYRQLRHLTRLRDNFSRLVARCKCQIKSLLLLEGLSLPDPIVTGRWSRRVVEHLKESKRYALIRFKLDRLLETLEFNGKQLLATQQEIRRFCQADPDISESITYLMSVPGIGWIVGAEILARIGDWRLLRNSRELGAFLGLTPRENSTGDYVRRGRITKAGHQRARKKLIEGSWMAVRRDEELKAFYWRIYRRHPRHEAPQKAIVAVARKLTARMYRVLKDRRCYEIRNKINKRMIRLKMVKG